MIDSRNGTFIGDERLEEGAGTFIESGTEMKFGNVVLVIEYHSISGEGGAE